MIDAAILSEKITENLDNAHNAGRMLADHIRSESMDQRTLLMEHGHLFDDRVRRFMLDRYEELESMLNHDRDYLFMYKSLKMLRHNYLFKVDGVPREGIQWCWMRVAVQVSMPTDGDPSMEEVKENYEILSRGEAIHATPTCVNAGYRQAQLESCFLIPMDDSMEGIQAARTLVAMGSKANGGFGLDCGRIRHGRVANRGITKGVPGLIKHEFDPLISYADQLGSRPGAMTVFLPMWHIDIETFIRMGDRKAPESIRATNVNYAIWVHDLFHVRRLNGGTWSLFCPRDTKKLWVRLHGGDDSDSKKVDDAPSLHDMWGREFEQFYIQCEQHLDGHHVDPRTLWSKICVQRCQTGQPFVMNADACNRKSNHQNQGTITQSNLCVRGDTLLLTDEGYVPIIDRVGLKTRAWNGEEWSTITPVKTGTNQKLLTVSFDNGSVIHCTPYHKFYIKGNIKKEAKDLNPGDAIIKCNYPIIDHFDKEEDDLYGDNAYTHGFFCGDGTYANGIPILRLYGKQKKALLKYLNIRGEPIQEKSQNRLHCYMPLDLPKKFRVPMKASIPTKLKWLAGYLDADGCSAKTGNYHCLQVCSIDRSFLDDIKLMLQTLGCNVKYSLMRGARKDMLPANNGTGEYKEYDCKPIWRMVISTRNLKKLHDLGFRTHRLKYTFPDGNAKFLKQRDTSRYIKVVSVVDEGERADTYCAREPKRGMLLFNGVITSQCVEIVQYTEPNAIAATCDLATINLVSFLNEDGSYDWHRLGQVTRQLVRNLDRVIDSTSGIIPNEGQRLLESIIRDGSKGDPLYDLAMSMYGEIKKDITYTGRMMNRAIGIGKMGLGSLFAMMGIKYASNEACDMADSICACIYWHAIHESHLLAMEHGSYPSYQGSPMSKGILQFDMWKDEDQVMESYGLPNYGQGYLRRRSYDEVDPSTFGVEEGWDYLRSLIKKGMRNSLLTCQMPNSTTAAIWGVTPSIEPFFACMHASSNVAGNDASTYWAVIDVAKKEGVYNPVLMANYMAMNNGSIDGIHQYDPDNKDKWLKIEPLFKRAFDINKKRYFMMVQRMGRYICQSQSLNWFFEFPNDKYMEKLDTMLWVNGAKTGQYYVHRKAVSNSVSTKSFCTKDNDGCISCQ